ncbi:MAG: TPM domain-containing protein [Chitinophagales bacterium]|nr:TPM domain-containing protein [Chitinophagales bacterium]
MKKLLLWLPLLLVWLCAIAANDLPEKPGTLYPVNDYAKVLSEGEIQQLNNKLIGYADSTSTEIVIVTVPTTGDYDISEYAIELGDKWGIGRKDKDNGILIVAAIEDRKLWIATGEGVEARITDGIAGSIRDEYLVPNFRSGNYYQGFDQATDAMFKYLSGEFKGEPKNNSGDFPIGVLIAIIIMIVVFSIIFGRRGGGGRGGMRGYGGMMGPILIGSSGWGRSGGSWGGGGGGFGGFGGGGSFGGGGAGGSW